MSNQLIIVTYHNGNGERKRSFTSFHRAEEFMDYCDNVGFEIIKVERETW